MPNDVIAVVRSYNDPDIVLFCERLLECVDQVVVVVPSNLDSGYTKVWIQAYLDESRARYVPTLVRTGNDWSAMLNAGLTYIRGLDIEADYVLNVSNTTNFTPKHVEVMRYQFDIDHASLGVVGTTFAGYLADDTSEPLGKAYSQPRNTGMMIDKRVFDAHRLLAGFDPRWDGAGGMEDYDFVGKMRALTPYRTKMLDLRVPLRIGRHRDQAEYTKLMEDGLAAVDAYHQEMGWR